MVQIPRPYQIEATDFLLRNKRGGLTDKPGMGKTLESSEAVVDKPCLVVAPTYLTQQWADHIESQYGDTVVLATGAMNYFQRAKALKRKADWYVINTDMLRTHSYNLPDCPTVIFDESHHLRNRKAIKSKVAAKYAADMDRSVYLLTATPIFKNADDLWMQFHLLQPEMFPKYNEFIDYFMVTDETEYGPKVLGIAKRHRKELDLLLKTMFFGRTYKDVGRQLPPTIVSNFAVELPEPLMIKYREVRDEYRLKVDENPTTVYSSYLAVLHILRAFTNFQGKRDALKDRLEDVGRPAVIFTWYVDVAMSLVDEIENSVLITGDSFKTPQDRMAAAYRAQSQGKTIVCTMSSLSEGVNLYDYRHVIFYEEDWPPGRNYQALSRIVRDRNDDGADLEPVIVDYIYVRGTIDQTIHKVAQKREATINDVIGDIFA